MADELIIGSEADLWALLERLVNAPPADYASAAPIRIQGWRPQLLYFPDERLGHSLSPSLARAITGFHASLSKAYAYAAYGQADVHFLKNADREALDIRMLVIEGSNGLQILDEALERLTHALLTKMSGKQMALIIVLYLLLNFGHTTMKDWLHEEYASKDHTSDDANALALSEQETERMQILASALNKNPPLKPVASIADEGRVPLLRGTLAYDRAKVLDTEITRDQAQSIVSKEKAKGIAKRLDGRFRVTEIDTENPEGYMGTLEDIKTGQEIRVSINMGELPETDVQNLFAALRGKASVDALVNTWMIGDKISFASIVRADPPKP